jgi:hypothetical protein
MTAKANGLVRSNGEIATKDRARVVCNSRRTITSHDQVYWDRFLEGHAELEKACKTVYAPVREAWETWLNDCSNKLRGAVEELVRIASEERTVLQAQSKVEIETFRSTALATIAGLDSTSSLNVLFVNPQKYAKLQIANQISMVA